MSPQIFYLQQQIAQHLIELLETKKITIKRTAEIAGQVLNIIPEDPQNLAFDEITRQLGSISELKNLEF